jgi:hypothetical protein
MAAHLGSLLPVLARKHSLLVSHAKSVMVAPTPSNSALAMSLEQGLEGKSNIDKVTRGPSVGTTL